MNRPRVATVLSARDWEASFAGIARSTSLIRLVARAYEPEDLERRTGELDVVVAGVETAWVTPSAIRRWRGEGLGVLGVHPPDDRPGRRLLTIGGADEVLPDDTPPERLLHVVRSLRRLDFKPPETATMVAVTGGRGAPGISETALGLAWGLARRGQRTLLIDLDRSGPSLSVRLGVAPAPDFAEAVDEVLSSGRFPSTVGKVGPLALLAGPPANRAGPLTSALINEVLQAAEGLFQRIVVDLGVAEPDDALLYRAASRVLTCEATAKGLIRAAATVEQWSAPPPVLVLNRIAHHEREEVVTAARRWLGLEPSVVIPMMAEVQDAARAAAPPPPDFTRLLEPLHDPARLGLT